MKIKINYYLCSVINEELQRLSNLTKKVGSITFKQMIMEVTEIQIKLDTSIGEVTIKVKPKKK